MVGPSPVVVGGRVAGGGGEGRGVDDGGKHLPVREEGLVLVQVAVGGWESGAVEEKVLGTRDGAFREEELRKGWLEPLNVGIFDSFR